MKAYAVRRLAEAFIYPKSKADAMETVRRLATEQPGAAVYLYTTTDRAGHARTEVTTRYRADDRGRLREVE